MPDVPGPEGLPAWDFVRPDQVPDEMRPMMERWRHHQPFELLSADSAEQLRDQNAKVQEVEGEVPRRRVWVRPRGVLPDEEWVHAAALAYASDMGLIATARMPHRLPRPSSAQSRFMGASASLDHAIWFHHLPRFDDWIVYVSESPVAHNARALIFGEMWSRDGRRLASVVQEGLIRVPRA
jgi:acyl-CoA thioesterase-2